MKSETFERQKPFAGEKKPSMQRRCVDHDYTGRMMYMVTMTTEGRRPLFGEVKGCSQAEPGSEDAPRVVLSALGERVKEEWWGIPHYHPQVEIIALQMMPDHLHGILFVREKMDCDLSRIIRGFKTGCNRHFRELFPSVPYVATQSQQTTPQHPAPLQAPPPQPVPSPHAQVPSPHTQVPSPHTQVPSPHTQVPYVATQRNSPHHLLTPAPAKTAATGCSSPAASTTSCSCAMGSCSAGSTTSATIPAACS